MSQPPPSGGPFYPPPPGGGYPGPGQQQPWPNQPPGAQWPPAPPPKRGNGWKWALGAVALLAVIGVTVAVTMSVSDGGNDTASPTSVPTDASGEHSEIASASDTGPVAVITEDPSCEPQRPILNMRAAAQRNGWNERDTSVPATAWTPEVRAQHEAVGESMRKSAEQLVPVAKLTPHRVMRELYEQIIVYSRAYADALPNYTASDDYLAQVSTTASNAVAHICGAITYGAATERGPLVAPFDAPSGIAPIGDTANPQRFMSKPNSVCSDWDEALSQFESDSKAWLAVPPDIPASQWTEEQRAVSEGVAPAMTTLANRLQELGERSGNLILRDFAELSAQYRLAYVEALPTYVPADEYLAIAAQRLAGMVDAACLAAAG